MAGFFDASCSKCHKRFGWMGGMQDKPACPKCGYREPQKELEAADAKLRHYRELLAKRPLDSKGEERRQQRVVAGLTLRQAAKELGIFPSDLSDYENDREPLPQAVATAMIEVYGLDEDDIDEPRPPAGHNQAGAEPGATDA